MKQTPDFLLEQETKKEPIGTDSLNELNSFVLLYQQQQERIKELEEQLKQEKVIFRQISEERIPTLLLSNGLSNIKLKTGENVNIKKGISVTIKDQTGFMKFLKKRKEESIIKLQLTISKTEHDKLNDLFLFLEKLGIDYTAKRDVHHKTKESYFKNLLGINLEEDERSKKISDGVVLTEQDIEGFAKVYQYYQTKIS